MEPSNERSSNGRVEGPTSSHPHASQHRRYKRFQACVACRATKTKCLPSEQHNSCQSCLRSSRPCVMPGPPKQRIKSAQKFSELEKKIEMLTNALTGRDQDVDIDANTTGAISDQQSTGDCEPRVVGTSNPSPNDQDDGQLMHSRKSDRLRLTSTPGGSLDVRLDVIDEGLVTKETATNLFNHWFNNMRCFMPVVFFLSDVEAEHIRETSPLLFLTILTVASSSTCPSLSVQLVTRLTHDFGQQVFAHNNQNVDTILAMLLFSQYHFKPGGSSSVAPSQYIYSAVALSLDLGLRSKARTILAKHSDAALEAARVCLSEWYSASMATILLHRTPIVHHTPELDNYADILQSKQRPSDKWLFNLVELQQIMEKAALLLDPSENKSETAFDEPSTQYKTNMLLQQLDRWEAKVPDQVDHRLKQHGRHVAYLQIQKLAIRCYVRKVTMQKQNKHGSTSTQDNDMMGFTPLHFDCLTKCIASIKALFDIYLSFDISLIRCLPNHYLSWNTTAAFLLIKLGHFGEILANLEQPSSGSKPKPTFQSTVVHYLDSIAAKMDHASQGGYIPQARPYINIFRKLKPYYLTKRNICINSHGDADVMDQEEPATVRIRTQESHTNPRTASNTKQTSKYSELQPGHVTRSSVHTPSSDRYSQPSSESISGSHWTPLSAGSHFDYQLQPYQATDEGQPSNQNLEVNAVYDPSTYANTDWTSFTLDQDQIEQLDTFMFSEEDISWMQSFL